MSAVPVGLDVRNFGFMLFQVALTAAENQVVCPDWFVTKISIFAADGAAATLRLTGPTGDDVPGDVGLLNIAAGGCYEVTPGGAYRTKIKASGDGARLVIEYWYPATAQGDVPSPVVL